MGKSSRWPGAQEKSDEKEAHTYPDGSLKVAPADSTTADLLDGAQSWIAHEAHKAMNRLDLDKAEICLFILKRLQ